LFAWGEKNVDFSMSYMLVIERHTIVGLASSVLFET